MDKWDKEYNRKVDDLQASVADARAAHAAARRAHESAERVHRIVNPIILVLVGMLIGSVVIFLTERSATAGVEKAVEMVMGLDDARVYVWHEDHGDLFIALRGEDGIALEYVPREEKTEDE